MTAFAAMNTTQDFIKNHPEVEVIFVCFETKMQELLPVQPEI